MQRIMHYIGILRIYSFVDLVLLLIAFGFSARELVGALLLWVAFLFLLEAQHKHSYRQRVHHAVPWMLFAIGLWFFGHILSGLVFLTLSYLYTLKDRSGWGMVSPLIRGLQPVALLGGFIYNPFVWIVGVLTFLRNLLGDIRDVRKDRKEGLKTLPVVFGLVSGGKYIHLLGVMVTTAIWWLLGGFSIWVLISVWIIEVGTYNLTPRNLE